MYPGVMPAPAPGSADSTSRTRKSGVLIAGRFRVEATLGTGGMGAVYRVVDEPTGRTLALKLFGGPAAHDQHRLLFRREFHTMARLSHPRIVRVFDYGLDGEMPYYTMELLDGLDLGDIGQVDVKRACGLLRDVASALAFLHARRLVHRDLAPRNVRCTSDGHAKLIDFGVLATAGFCGHVAGTAPLIPPESVRGLPIDHRADLFGLGALAYRLLSGAHAYPARSLEDLEPLWRSRPLPPSAGDPAVPPALDELVMSLLALDPLGRPASAAEVIDRLCAIAGLPATPDVETARGYLASASLVGRQREMEILQRRLARAVGGDGSAIVLEAPSGRGKSRLLRELGLEAQIAGATVLSADSESAGRGPYGLFCALAETLLTAAPAEALAAARPRGQVLARIVPKIGDLLGPLGVATPSAGPEEDRMQAQEELASWLLDVARTRTLVLLVDDVQRSDEASAAVLTTLAHAAPGRNLLVAVALRTDEKIRATAAVTTLRDLGHRVRVRPLEADDVEELMRGTFGDVAHLARLSTWMQKASGGSPLHCMELARHLVDRGVIRYVDGIWSVPDDPRLDGLPTKLALAMEARIGALSSSARELAEALSVHGGELPLAICVSLAESADEASIFVALDELLFEEVLIGSGDSYRFRHDGLREALLRNLTAERRKRLHVRVGRALLGQGRAPPSLEAEIGWHLLRGGAGEEGAELLAKAGARLFAAQSFSDAVAPLEAALEVYEGLGRSPRTVLPIRHMLVMAGCFSDRNVALKYAGDTIRAYATYSGLALANRLVASVPRLVALALGFTWAGLRWLYTRPARRGPAPAEAMRLFYTTLVPAAVVRSLSMHASEVRTLLAMAEIFTVFKGRVPEGATLLISALLAMPLGRFGWAERVANAALTILAKDHATPMSEVDRSSAAGGGYYVLAMVFVQNQSPRCLDEVARLEGLHLRYFEVNANTCRIAYRRLRGEEEVALEIEARTDVLLIQAGSMWGPETTIVWLSSMAYGLTRDVLGLRRSIERLAELVDQGFALVAYLELARGEYARERGELDVALRALERAIASLEPDEAFVRPVILCALAETLLGRHEIERAMELAQAAILLCRDPEVNSVTWRLRATRALALAEAANGDIPSATARLDGAIDEAAVLGSPSLCGSLHEGRARVAAMASDAFAFALHRNATDSWFRPTRNPALIAWVDRLPDPSTVAPRSSPAAGANDAATFISGRLPPDVSTVVTDAAVTSMSPQETGWVSAVLTGCRGPHERAARALELLLDAAQSKSGYLYLLYRGSLELMAPAYGEEPHDALALAVAAAFRAPPEELLSRVAVPRKSGVAASEVGYKLFFLTIRHGQGHKTVGVVAVLDGGERAQPTRAFLTQIAGELYEAGDVTTGQASNG